MTSEVDEKYNQSKIERQKYVEAVLNSQSSKNIVVAGPGTGKTYLFKELLKTKQNTLTLTFVNSLVEDLSLELCGISDVKTLHGFARSILASTTSDSIKVFPWLSEVIKEDAKILIGQDVDFNDLFHERDDDSEYLEFYEKRRNYYDKYFGYSDIVFTAVKYLEDNKDKIPSYQHVVVDEFQDFNKLEVSLIDLLAEKNSLLLAGDDDQALYHFKKASPDHIRERHKIENTDYASFTLPFCSRCTKVIVESTNDIIGKAIDNNHLNNRINKEYKYFDDEIKDKVSIDHPKLVYSQVYARQIPWFIEQRIYEIAEHEKSSFSVLIISPTKVQIRSIVSALRGKGFTNIEFTEKKDGNGLMLLDGLKILLEDNKSNLGWRIVTKSIFKDKDFKELLKKTNEDDPKDVIQLVSKDVKNDVNSMLKVCKSIKANTAISSEDLDEFFRRINIDPREKTKEFLLDEIYDTFKKSGNMGIKKIPIKATTVQSSKGLAADYVFITYFDDRYFISNSDKTKISDQDICSFLVALTRAKKKIFLISSNTNDPTFLSWIGGEKIQRFS
jgi:superfamily I DNA/RNA helicase